MTSQPQKAPTMSMAEIARCRHVFRWHSIKTGGVNQSLSDHMYIVGIVTNRLCKDIFGSTVTPEQRLQLLEYALWHDTPEAVTSTDMASPYKRRIKQICEEEGIINPIDLIDDEIAPFLKDMKANLSELPAFRLVKIADLLDAYTFIYENGQGKHAEKVAEKTKKAFLEKVAQAKEEHPQYDWDKAIELLELMADPEGAVIQFEGV